MSNLVFIEDYLSQKQHKRRRVTFDRRELGQLFSVYSRRVKSGEWKDYAINHDSRMAVFSIFKKSSEQPLFAVAKLGADPNPDGGYLLFNGHQILRRGRTIGEVLCLLKERNLRLIST